MVSVLVALGMWGAILVFFFGAGFVNKQIYSHGKKGEGTVIAYQNTGDLYNEEPIIRYDVLINTRNGETVETSFESNDFVLYPTPDDSYTYPSNGLTFNVRYLEKYPEAFVIVTDDTSDYAKGIFCAQKRNALNIAKHKFDFDTNNATYKKNYLNAIDTYLKSDCIYNPEMRAFYEKEKTSYTD